MVLLQTPDYALQRVFKATFGLITVSPLKFSPIVEIKIEFEEFSPKKEAKIEQTKPLML